MFNVTKRSKRICQGTCQGNFFWFVQPSFRYLFLLFDVFMKEWYNSAKLFLDLITLVQDHLIVRLKIWLRTVWRFKEVFLEFFFRYKLFSDRALSNLKSIGIEQVRLDSTIFARQPPNVCTSSSRDERWREEEKIVAKKDYLRRLIADRHLLSRMILTVRKRHCLTHVTTAALSLAMAANGQRPEIPLPDVVW